MPRNALALSALPYQQRERRRHPSAAAAGKRRLAAHRCLGAMLALRGAPAAAGSYRLTLYPLL